MKEQEKKKLLGDYWKSGLLSGWGKPSAPCLKKEVERMGFYIAIVYYIKLNM